MDVLHSVMVDDANGISPELAELLSKYLEQSARELDHVVDLARARRRNKAAAAAYRERRRLELIRIGLMSGETEEVAATTGASVQEIEIARAYVRNKRKAFRIKERNRDMLALHRHGWTYRKIANHFRLSSRQIGKIIRRERAIAHCADPLAPSSPPCPDADPHE